MTMQERLTSNSRRRTPNAMIKATLEYKTVHCFRGKDIWYRGGEFDYHLPPIGARSGAGNPVPYMWDGQIKVGEAAHTIIHNDWQSKYSLIGHRFSLPQIQEVLNQKERYGFEGNGKGNYFLVEHIDGSDAIVDARLFRDGRFAVYVRGLNHWMETGDRFFDMQREKGYPLNPQIPQKRSWWQKVKAKLKY